MVSLRKKRTVLLMIRINAFIGFSTCTTHFAEKKDLDLKNDASPEILEL